VIRVLICDDQDIVREGLRALLSIVPSIEVAGVASNGAEAGEMIECDHVDVVLMDLKMPIMNGVRATAELRARCESVKILVLTTLADEEWVLDAIDAGAHGYLLKDAPRERLVEAIEDVAAGRNPVDAAVAGNLFHRSAGSRQSTAIIDANLTERETEVLGLIGLGLSNTDIAERLFLSEGTVRNYVSNILTKLAVEDRTQAAVLSIRAGLPPE
jgi:DNA-binding NarL/FixJ family response regulator